jgi:hypothetical protein
MYNNKFDVYYLFISTLFVLYIIFISYTGILQDPKSKSKIVQDLGYDLHQLGRCNKEEVTGSVVRRLFK